MAEVGAISIIGGGIGGLATAIALRGRGFNVRVYERAQALKPAGAGLTLSPNGLNSLEAIQPGIVEALKRAGSEVQRLTMRRSTGETIISKAIELAPQFGQPMLNIHWSRLQSVLASALPPGAIRLDSRCAAIEQDGACVRARFDNGEVAESDVLIGADGINSAVRQALFADGAPAYAGRMSWRGVIQYRHENLTQHASTGYTAPDGKNFMLFDLGENYTCWSAGVVTAEAAASKRAEDAKDRVLAAYAGWADLVEGIVKATPAADIVERPISDRPPLKRWSEARITLMGDAAHPVVPALGQGANMAFEDAYELAGFLAAAPDVATAFDAYEASRIPRTDAIYARSARQGFSSYKPDSDATLAETVARISDDEFQVWLYGYRPEAVDF